MHIGEIVTQADLQSIQRENEKFFSQRAYLAPTVFRLAAAGITNYNYYATRDDAFKKALFLLGKGGANITPAGSVAFTNAATAQTFGINADFYILLPTGWTVIPYAVLKSVKNWTGVVVKFYKTNAAGPFYAILDSRYFGLSASTIASVPANKIAALDDFHRELQILKVKYNTLSEYLTTLSKKTSLNAAQQQSFNEGLLLLNSMKEQIRTIQGVEFTYNVNGQVSIGIIPIIYIIVAAVIVAAAAAWTIDRVTTERNKTARINAAFNMQQWISEQKLKIAAAARAGTISQASADQMTNDLTAAQKKAEQVAADASKETEGVLDKVQNLVLIVGGVYIISKFIN